MRLPRLKTGPNFSNRRADPEGARMTTPQPPVDPPDLPLTCTWCEGNLVLSVISFIDSRGRIKHISPDYGPEIECPHCHGCGNEPAQEPDPDRQRDEAKERALDEKADREGARY